jgi:2-dehydro-3-deoxyphosphogluconate aldolase/(4S)-4-hydroxy-2-oxoglutarate aldolase
MIESRTMSVAAAPALRGSALKAVVAASLRRSPITAVVRHKDRAEAARQARAFVDGGLELIEITFTVPDAVGLVRELLAERTERTARGPAQDGGPWIGMGTVTTAERAEAAVAAGAEFLISPNVAPEVAAIARREGLFFILGALTPTEIAQADALGSDVIKVYPLPPVGGPAYLAVVRQPLGDVAPMLAGGGFGIEEIPAYRAAGASAFGIGAPLLGATPDETRARITRALELARG